MIAVASSLRYCDVVTFFQINTEASLVAILFAGDNDGAINRKHKNTASSLGLLQVYWGGEDRKENLDGNSGPITTQE